MEIDAAYSKIETLRPVFLQQKGRRPALFICRRLFNRGTGMAIVCPITNSFRNMPFHVAIPEENKLTGYVMVEQVK